MALQPRVLARLADFHFRGIADLNPKETQTYESVTLLIYRETIEQSVFQGYGHLVKGGEMRTVPGCSFLRSNLRMRSSSERAILVPVRRQLRPMKSIN